MEQPEVFTPENYEVLAGSMQPVYGQTRGLSNKTIVRAQQMALEVRKMEREYMPPDLRRRYELAEINYSMEHIHFPADQTELLFARKRLVFDEFFMFLVGVRRLKEHREDRHSAFMIKEAEEVTAFQSSLPYALTGAQERALREVYDDMGSGLVMNRLIQGDVGSGKTIIAILALLQAAYNGYQGALMVPTEVLARQHFESITSLFEKQGIEKVPVLVTGSMTAKEKRLVQCVPLACVSLGQTLVIISGGIDLSVGSTISVCTAIAARLMGSDNPAQVLLGVVVVFAFAAGVGLVNGAGVNYLKVPPMITTLCTSTILEGVALWILPVAGGKINADFARVIYKKWDIISMPLLILVALFLVMRYLLYRTRTGTSLYAIGRSRTIAASMGIKTTRASMKAYVLAALCAAVTGLLLASRMRVGDPTAG